MTVKLQRKLAEWLQELGQTDKDLQILWDVTAAYTPASPIKMLVMSFRCCGRSLIRLDRQLIRDGMTLSRAARRYGYLDWIWEELNVIWLILLSYMNSILYDVHSEIFFHLDEGGRKRHEKKLFKKYSD